MCAAVYAVAVPLLALMAIYVRLWLGVLETVIVIIIVNIFMYSMCLL